MTTAATDSQQESGNQTLPQDGDKNQQAGKMPDQKANSQDGKKAHDSEGAGEHDVDSTGWDEKTRGYITKLRAENARYRTKGNEAETKLSSVEQRMSQMESGIKKAFGLEEKVELTQENFDAIEQEKHGLVLENAILQTAYERGIAKDDIGYFKFLISDRLNSLEEGGELSEEDFDQIVSSVNRRAGSSSTSVNSGTGNDKNKAPGEPEGVSLDDFIEMSISDKSALYEKQPETYHRLMKEAKRHKRLV